MHKRLITVVALLAAATCSTQTATAIDIVSLKSNTTASQGEITEVTKEGVTVKPRIGAPKQIPANDIVNIRWDGAPPKLALAHTDEQGGRLQKALDSYVEIQGESANASDNFKLDLQYLIARTTARMALADPTKLADAVKKLEDFSRAGSDNFRYYESKNYLGQVYVAQKEFDKAQTAFDELAKAPWNDFKMAAQSANARLRLLQGDIAGALAGFETVIAAEAKEPAELTRRYEALLGKASCLIQEKKFEEAVTVLEEVVNEVPGDESQIQAEAYVRQGECLQALGKSKEAVLAYLHVPVLFPGERAQQAESLYHLARLWGTVGQPERGADARAMLESDFPNSEWLKKLGGTAN